ncbi:MAG: hypothetical protein PVF49_03570 [Anaerolineales bacterium]|jgi:hypothetical protein
MLKRIVIGILSLSVFGAGSAAAVNQAIHAQEAEIVAEQVLADPVNVQAQNLAESSGAGQGQPWSALGEITAVDEAGLRLRTANGREYYVELGPSSFWQSHAAQLQIGQTVEITGTDLEGMIHAYQVQFQNGEVLTLRDETGQPLWSGGSVNGQGQNAQTADGDHTPEPQAQVDEWITVEGSLLAYQNGSMTISTVDGDLLSFKTGQPRFLASQGVVFQVGDEVRVIGFFDDSGEFMAGEITQVSTGLRVMLRDPNGRPLWAGPGNSAGNGNGNGYSN